jgi:hypothetical protein
MLTPKARDPDAWAGLLARDSAIRATLAWDGHPSLVRSLLTAVGRGGTGIGLLVLVVLVMPRIGPLPSLTSFVWPFVSMSLIGGAVYRIVGQSRVLWLKIGGGRDEVRRVIERAAWQTGLAAFSVVVIILLLLTVQRSGVTAREFVLGLTVCTSAAVYGGYVSLAAVRGVRTQIVGFGLMALAQLALLARGEPAVTSVVIIAIAQLLGVASFRALALRRWRQIDWRIVQPLRGLQRMS